MKEVNELKEALKITKVSQRMMSWALHRFQFDVLKIGAGTTSGYPIPSKTLVISNQRKERN
jgi:hypothetical protein